MAQALQRGLGAWGFVLAQQNLAICSGDRHHRCAAARRQGGHGALLRCQGVGVALGAVKALHGGDHIGRNAYGHQRGLLLELQVVRQGAFVRRHGHAGHHLHTAGRGQAVCGHGLLRRQVHGAQARGAVAVDAQARHAVAPASAHQGQLGNVGALLAGLADAAHECVAHLGRVNAGALGQGCELLGQQIHRFDVAQRALVVAPASGAAQRVNDEGLAHACSLESALRGHRRGKKAGTRAQ